MLPVHRNYVEVFGGAAGVLLRKDRSHIEVYNDLDRQVVSIFQILRDKTLSTELIRAVALTPFAREEFESSYDTSDDPIEAARRFIFRCYSGHGTCSVNPADSNGFRSCDIRAGKAYAREWDGIPESISSAGSRLQGVTIENLDFRRLIPKFDAPETFFFVDPPYPRSTRDSGGKGYLHEMSDHDHEQLSWLLHQIKGRAMVCGYQCGLYDRIYHDWTKAQKSTTAAGQSGAVPRTECVWMNY